MMTSDFAVLAFLAGASIIAPRSHRATAALLSVTLICGVVSMMVGDTELPIATGAVLSALLLAYAGAGVHLWRLQRPLRAYRQSTAQ